MRLYEKILIGFGILILGIQLLPSFNGKTISFIFANWFIALSYLIGGYWLLNPKENKKYIVPILAGIVFGTSLVVFPMLIKVKIELLYKKIPLINGCFFIGLGIYLFINRNTKEIIQAYKRIFIRSAIILAVVSFFAYTPSTFTPYSHILWALNKGSHQLEHNKKMFKSHEKFEEAFKNGDCESAIIYAEESNEAGQKWLNIYRGPSDHTSTMEEAIKLLESKSMDLFLQHTHSNQFYHPEKDLKEIGETFSNLYSAYKCKADKYQNTNNHKQALYFYLTAYNVLKYGEHHSKYWNIKKENLLKVIALSSQELGYYEYADSVSLEAAKESVKNKRPSLD